MDGWVDVFLSPAGLLPDLCTSLSGNDRTESPADPRSDQWITDPAVSQSVSQLVGRWSSLASTLCLAWLSVGRAVLFLPLLPGWQPTAAANGISRVETVEA